MRELEYFRSKKINPSGDDEDYLISKQDREVSIDKMQLSLFELYKSLEQGTVALKFFTKSTSFSWTHSKASKSKLIESALMTLPLTPIYLVQIPNDSTKQEYVVVDGRQRLKIFSDYISGKFPLTQLMIFPELNNKSFRDLDSSDRRKLEDYKIQVNVIRPSTPLLLQFDIVQRIHSNRQINGQEIRNLIFPEEITEFLNQTARDDQFNLLMRSSNTRTVSLKQQETVLRFYAFYIMGYQEYTGNLDWFLNRAFALIDMKIDSSDFLDVRMKFRTAMSLLVDVFGEDSYFISTRSQFLRSRHRHFELDLTHFELLSTSFAQYDSESIYRRRSQIRTLFYDLLTNDARFSNACTSNPYEKQ
ncbi:MAG: GmrSD restriction endonuclease domain-containing protein, partial [Tumebacillaceae bacterium]